MANLVIHFEILGSHGTRIGGAVGAANAAPDGGVLLYVEVDDLHDYIERATDMGQQWQSR